MCTYNRIFFFFFHFQGECLSWCLNMLVCFWLPTLFDTQLWKPCLRTFWIGYRFAELFIQLFEKIRCFATDAAFQCRIGYRELHWRYEHYFSKRYFFMKLLTEKVIVSRKHHCCWVSNVIFIYLFLCISITSSNISLQALSSELWKMHQKQSSPSMPARQKILHI